MMHKGRWELPLTIGFILSYYNFRIPFNSIFGNTSGSHNCKPNYQLFDENLGGTGRGGWPWDLNGDDGRLPPMEKYLVVEPVMSGTGGTIEAGGTGYQAGRLGVGGHGCLSDLDANLAPGGGAGVHGGGSGFISGGAGGGSSAVLLDLPYKYNEYLFDAANCPNITVGQTADVTGGLLYSESDKDVNTAPFLYDLNTEHSSYYWSKNHKDWTDTAWEDYLSVRLASKGHGFIMVSKPNEEIKISKTKGWLGVSNVFYFDPLDTSPVEIVFNETAKYHIICFGGAGGSIGAYSPQFEYLAGGFGGCASAILGIPAGTRLYGFIGERGQNQKMYSAFNGGGRASAGCTGGGGATDIRYTNDPTALRTRIIVAGGGGGIFGAAYGGSDPEDLYIPKYTKYSHLSSGSLGINKYKVNDQSLVRVSFSYTGNSEVTTDDEIEVTIKIQDGKEGTLKKTVKLDNMSTVVEFDLSEVYEENTPTHQVTIEAVWDTDVQVVINSESVNITVDTKPRPNESSAFEKLPILLRVSEVISVNDGLNYATVRYEAGNEKMISIDELISLYDNATIASEAINNKYIEIAETMTLGELIEMELINTAEPETEPEFQDGTLSIKENMTLLEVMEILKVFKGSVENKLVETIKISDKAELIKE